VFGTQDQRSVNALVGTRSRIDPKTLRGGFEGIKNSAIDKFSVVEKSKGVSNAIPVINEAKSESILGVVFPVTFETVIC
jgi:hypothetical protein